MPFPETISKQLIGTICLISFALRQGKEMSGVAKLHAFITGFAEYELWTGSTLLSVDLRILSSRCVNAVFMKTVFVVAS